LKVSSEKMEKTRDDPPTKTKLNSAAKNHGEEPNERTSLSCPTCKGETTWGAVLQSVSDAQREKDVVENAARKKQGREELVDNNGNGMDVDESESEGENHFVVAKINPTRDLLGDWSTKTDAIVHKVIDIIDRDDKVVIFSCFDSYLGMLKAALIANGIQSVFVETSMMFGVGIEQWKR